ncbi:MAG: class I SAM-dependent methyltransferase [Acetobacter sp.]|nr:class I SAM-dependent methyltransferase [Bacteroides sp.]MCM1341451.1 class I SAM-dependent methyltransferase [Acetobacter sp.]
MITNKNIDNGNKFDWGLASSDYAKYRDIYPEEFYKRIVDLSYCTNNQKVLDLGTGTGVLPRNMAKYGAEFVGTDISENQIKYAKELSEKASLKINYIVSSAEDLEFDNNCFDIVTACQCFMYFDKSIILPKIHRFLKDDGHFLILYMAWLPFESEIAKTSEDLVLKYNPSWTGRGMTKYNLEEPEWSKKYFSLSNAITYETDIPFTRETWHGRIKACRGIGASSLSESEIDNWEKEHLKYLKTVPNEFTIPHYVSILDLKKK